MNSQVFDWVKGSGQLDTVEGLTTTQVKEGAADSVRTGNVVALVTLGSFAPQNRKGKKETLCLDRLIPYQGSTWGKQP